VDCIAVAKSGSSYRSKTTWNHRIESIMSRKKCRNQPVIQRQHRWCFSCVENLFNIGWPRSLYIYIYMYIVFLAYCHQIRSEIEFHWAIWAAKCFKKYSKFARNASKNALKHGHMEVQLTISSQLAPRGMIRNSMKLRLKKIWDSGGPNVTRVFPWKWTVLTLFEPALCSRPGIARKNQIESILSPKKYTCIVALT
jgi:hypothetical protein